MNRPKLRRLLRTIAPIALALIFVVLLQSVALACPGCKEGLAANDPSGTRAARGYFWSILFMLSMPPAIICTLCGYFYYEVRRARAGRDRIAQQESTAQHQVDPKAEQV
jgi:hypothetical protein